MKEPVCMRPCIIILIISLACFSAGAGAQESLIEAESFTDFHDIKGDPIAANVLEGEGFLSGLDVPGEWTGYSFNPGAFGTRSASIRVQGEEGVLFQLQLLLIPASGGESQTVVFEYTGAGFS